MNPTTTAARQLPDICGVFYSKYCFLYETLRNEEDGVRTELPAAKHFDRLSVTRGRSIMAGAKVKYNTKVS